MITASVLVFQLMNTVRMDRDERIAASRVVYSLYLNIVILVRGLPAMHTQLKLIDIGICSTFLGNTDDDED